MLLGCPNAIFMDYWERHFYDLPIILFQYNKRIGRARILSLFEGVGRKYWDKPIIIEERECIEKLLEHILFLIVVVYWRKVTAVDALTNSTGRNSLLS